MCYVIRHQTCDWFFKRNIRELCCCKWIGTKLYGAHSFLCGVFVCFHIYKDQMSWQGWWQISSLSSPHFAFKFPINVILGQDEDFLKFVGDCKYVCVPVQRLVCVQPFGAAPADRWAGPAASPEPGQSTGPESQHPPPATTRTTTFHTLVALHTKKRHEKFGWEDDSDSFAYTNYHYCQSVLIIWRLEQNISWWNF